MEVETIAKVLAPLITKPTFVSYKIANDKCMDKNSLQHTMLTDAKEILIPMGAFPPIGKLLMESVLENVAKTKISAEIANKEAGFMRLKEDDTVLVFEKSESMAEQGGKGQGHPEA